MKKIVATILAIVIMSGTIVAFATPTEKRYELMVKFLTLRDRNIDTIDGDRITYFSMSNESTRTLINQYTEFRRTFTLPKGFSEVYAVGEFYRQNYEYNDNIYEPNDSVRHRSGNCQGITQSAISLLKHLNINYYVITGKLDGIEHMWFITEDNGKWYMTDFTQVVSNQDISWAKRGYVENEYEINYLPKKVADHDFWFYGDKNIMFSGKFYAMEFGTLFELRDSQRVPWLKGLEDIGVSQSKLVAKVNGQWYERFEKYLITQETAWIKNPDSHASIKVKGNRIYVWDRWYDLKTDSSEPYKNGSIYVENDTQRIILLNRR